MMVHQKHELGYLPTFLNVKIKFFILTKNTIRLNYNKLNYILDTVTTDAIFRDSCAVHYYQQSCRYS